MARDPFDATTAKLRGGLEDEIGSRGAGAHAYR